MPCPFLPAGIDEASVHRRRREILSTSGADLAAFADTADTVRDTGRVVVVTSEAALSEYHKDTRRPVFEVLRPLQDGGYARG